MSEKKNYIVVMIGVPDSERNILRNIFKLSVYRPHTCTIMLDMGSSAACRLLNHETNTKDIPVVFVTSKNQKADRRE